MKITCKNKECNESQFHATAHVAEEWLIDDGGNWIGSLDTSETVNGPFVEEATCVCGSGVEVKYE